MKVYLATAFQVQCKDGSRCIFKTQICDFNPQCADQSDEANCGVCNFDTANNTCGWTDISADRFVWEQHRGGTPSRTSGPSSDHSGSGMYMFVDSTASQVGFLEFFFSAFVL